MGMEELFDMAPGMDDATRALGILRAAITSLSAVETSGNVAADEQIMLAEQALRRASKILQPK
jgi:hypothetical protein